MSTEATDPTTPGRGARLLRDRLRQRAGASPSTVVPVVSRAGGVPLSSAQQRLWVLDQLRPGGTDYLVPVVLRLSGPLDATRFARALDALIDRHEVLRTRYTDRDGTPVQLVEDRADVELIVDDRPDGDAGHWRALVDADAARPFDLGAGPVLRARLIRLAPDDHVFCLVVHHIAVDGWSADILIRDLAALYGAPDALPPVTVQHADAVSWLRDRLATPRSGDDTAHWLARLAGLPALELPLDRPRPAIWDPAGDTVRAEIPAAVAQQVARLARERGATPYMVHLAGLWALLGRYSGQRDFAVGTVVSGRTHAALEDVVGVFINMLALRADLSGEPAFADLVDRARDTAVDAFGRPDVPFERLVAELAVDRDLSSHPLFQVNLVWSAGAGRFEAGELSGTEVPTVSRSAKFDLTWALTERADGSMAVEVTYAQALFDRVTAERMAAHYVRLISAAVAEPHATAATLPLLDQADLAVLLRPAGGATPDGPALHERFAEQARRDPEAVAVRDRGCSLTYGEVDARANRLARRLHDLGIGREDLVGVCLPRGAELVVTLLAILKAGAAYLPCDPDHPDERISYVLRDAGARVAVTVGRLAGRIDTAEVLIVDDDDERARLAALPAGPPPVHSHPGDLAYVIYTSGSTGRPKGVAVTHANVVRLHTSTAAEYRFGPADRWLLFHSYAFDVSVWEMWGALMHGGRLVIVPGEVARSPWDLLELMAEEGVTVLNQTPSAFAGLVDLASRGDAVPAQLRLRLVILAGEPVDVATLEPWWKRFGDTSPQIVNKYGITETTVHTTYRPLGLTDLAGDRSPIGGPVRDSTLYVLDDTLSPAPIGVPAEIHVGGPGVTRGYPGRPALTAERFVPDPYGPPGARLYRSGDRARVLANGDIAFLGRFDHQVKIRGFRVELGEIESALAAHRDVESAVVIVDEPGPGEKRLVAYVVPAVTGNLDLTRLRSHLAGTLPGYMVPARFVPMPALPLTVNGKVDRRALPDPDDSRPELAESYSAPLTPVEQAVAGVWADVLGVTEVGVHDNFFALGGDSIRAVRLIGLLRAAGHDFSVQDVFRHQTVAALTRFGGGDRFGTEVTGLAPFALVDAADRDRLPGGITDAYPMTFGQSGMVYEMLADPERNLYHNITSYLIRDDGRFDPRALEVSAGELVRRHEILRTGFDLGGYREPLQLVHDRAAIRFGATDLRDLPESGRPAALAAFRAAERAARFDLAAPPLIRVHAHQVSDQGWYLSFTECHAILDGWSHNSLITELLELYRAARAGAPPPRHVPPSVRFADFVDQERRSATGEADRDFWAGRLTGTDRLTIPAGWAGPESGGPGEHEAVVDIADLERGLRALAEGAGASLKSVLLAAHTTVWRAIGGGRRFSSGLVCNGRTEAADGDRVRGMFLNTVPFVAPTGDTWRELVRAVFHEEVEVWPHRRYPLPLLQRQFGAGARLLDVAFNYLDFHVLDRRFVDTSQSTDESPNEFPFALSTAPGAVVLTARPEWIAAPYLDLLAAAYRRVLSRMAADPDGRTDLPVFPSAERRRQLDLGRGARRPAPGVAVHDLIAAQAAARPGAVAVSTAGADDLTYRGLVARADAWTAALRDLGVVRGDRVAICLPRSPDWAAAVLGVLGAGAAYVPVDPHHPPTRIAALVEAAGARVIVADGAPADRSAGSGRRVLRPGAVAGRADGSRRVPVDPGDVAYVVHTSGSTGRPKGVMVTHDGLAQRVASFCRSPGLDSADVLAAVVPAITDVAQLDLLAPLVAGGRLILGGDDVARDPQAMAGLLRAGSATVAQAAPTTWHMLWETGWRPPAGFRAISGGEVPAADLTRRLVSAGAEVWDMYGPNEATIFCSGSRIGPDGSSQHWQAAENTDVYVLDDALQPTPAGVVGQLHIGGAGLARGYLNAPGLTAAAFVADPHATEPGRRMYRTGDLARRDLQGRVVIVGRADHQVKVRGFRVEVAEVENALAAHPAVRAAVVHPVTGADAVPHLIAWVITEPAALPSGELHGFLAARLPEHMVPVRWVEVEAFPTLPNGKVDRSALPLPAMDAPVGPHEPPADNRERAIAGVWADVLGVARVGRTDDFFAIGGHSLLMMRIIARLHQEHGIEVTFRDFLDRRTVANLAADRPAATTARPALHWLRAPGARPALFCLHPGGGSGHWYRVLAGEMAPGRGVAAFEWPGLHGEYPPAGDVPDIAARYVAELRAAQPDGPYHLLGWCGSSGIAWEMARQLRDSTAGVRLILLDPVVDLSDADRGAHEAKLAVFRRAERLFDELATRDEDEGDRIRVELAAVLRDVVDDGDVPIGPDDVGPLWAYRLRSWRELLQARLGYAFGPYAGRIDLVICDELAEGRHEAILGQAWAQYLESWRRRSPGGLRVHRVPGDHLGVLRLPHVRELARSLDRLIDSSLREAS